MPKVATINIREELIEEIRNVLKRTGRYRSISEFVAEAIRLRLEEIGSRDEAISETPPVKTASLNLVSVVQPEITEGTRGYINVALQRSEQIWWVLVKLFGDLVKKGV